MKAVSKIVTGSVGLLALVGSAAPAAAQYPGYGYGGGGDILGAIINSVLGQNRGYGSRYGYGYGYDPQRERYLVERCARATESRIQRNYGYAGYNQYGYGGYGSYGYNQPYSGARIVSITHVERRSSGGVKIYGTATSGRANYGGYGGGYGGYGGHSYNAGADLRFDCTVSYNGRISDIDVSRNRYRYGY